MDFEETTAEVPELEADTLVERIEKKDLLPMHDTNHEHRGVLDGEVMGDFVAVRCENKDCNLGWFIHEKEAWKLKKA